MVKKLAAAEEAKKTKEQDNSPKTMKHSNQRRRAGPRMRTQRPRFPEMGEAGGSRWAGALVVE